MAERFELKDDEVEQVVGGTFQFFGGGTRCFVLGNVYTCSEMGQFQVIKLMNANPDLTEGEYLQMALAQGILTPYGATPNP